LQPRQSNDLYIRHKLIGRSMYTATERRIWAGAFLLVSGLLNSPTADAQSASAPANKPVPPPRPNTPVVRQIPFPQARGGGPLQITIDGLSEGVSRVGAGKRLFG